MSKRPFDEIYGEAVREAISILGEGASLVTGYLEKKYSIDLAATARNPKALSEALEAAIDGGSRVVQRRLLRLLYEKMNLKSPSAMMMTVNFDDQIIKASQYYESGAAGT